jgi:hypothetical protein
MAVQASNHLGVATLLRNKADYKIRSCDGQNPFDLIKDANEWINSGCFENEEILILKSKILNIIINLSHLINNFLNYSL